MSELPPTPPSTPPGETPPPMPASSGQPAAPSADSRNLALLCHLLAIFTGFLGPLIIWLIKKDQDPFIDDQGKEALNFQITVMIAALCCLVALCAAPFLLVAIQIADVVLCILATIETSKGNLYRYPFCLRLVK